ncbi:MAG: hypothetical protein ACTS3T_09795, partial [Almyronema sp.]
KAQTATSDTNPFCLSKNKTHLPNFVQDGGYKLKAANTPPDMSLTLLTAVLAFPNGNWPCPYRNLTQLQHLHCDRNHW